MVYLTIIPQARVGYELAITISLYTSASGIIVLLKTPKELQNLSSQLFSLTRIGYHICGQWYMSSYTIACEPIKMQELQYTIASS